MEEFISRLFNDVIARLDGPLHFRFILQPCMAVFLAARDGLKDAREGRPPYFWSLYAEPDLRLNLLREGGKSISKVFIIAAVLDVLYQLIVLRWFYPLETLIVAVLLALVPYVLVRGSVGRIKRGLQKSSAGNLRVGVTQAASRGGESGRRGDAYFSRNSK